MASDTIPIPLIVPESEADMWFGMHKRTTIVLDYCSTGGSESLGIVRLALQGRAGRL